ncbi:hypothetical protein EV702DRAFT_1202991 [Suillus placidus]|uniref:Uncharacterized protein n=1 Tax=Suillus placidus TaxID=48579 RepID=A0A9P6ZKH8_9AGAM|nr:hypothetical protein EV702DRAFT_1202991 [Suillus placidus]
MYAPLNSHEPRNAKKKAMEKAIWMPEKSARKVLQQTQAPPNPPASRPPTKPPTKPSTKPPTKPSTKPPTKPSTKPPTKPSTKPPTKPSTKPPTKAKRPVPSAVAQIDQGLPSKLSTSRI